MGKLESHMQKNETRLLFVNIHKNELQMDESSKYNTESERVNPIEENICTKLMDLGLGLDFMNLTSNAREVKAKIKECNYIKLNSLCTAK